MRVLLWLLAFPMAIANGQWSEYWLKAIVQNATYFKPGEWKLTLTNPGTQNLADSSGFAVGSIESSPYRNQNLTSVLVISISSEKIEATASTFEELQKGDLVFLKAKLSNIQYRGILSNLIRTGVHWIDSNGQPYYSIQDFESGNKEWESQVLEKMLADVKVNPAETIIEAGINRGKKISEVTTQFSLSTIRNFLNYAEKVPQTFSDTNSNFREYFERWLRMGSPDISSVEEILKTGSQNASKLKSTLSDLGVAELLIALTNASQVRNSFDSKIDNANELKTVAGISPSFLKGNDLGYVYFTYGSALHAVKDFKASESQYILAAEAFENENAIQYARAASRQAECGEQLKEYLRAIELYNQSSALWRGAIEKNPNLYNYSRLRIVLEGLARCLDTTEKHQDYINTQIELASVLKKLELLLNRGNAYWNIGYTYGVKLKEFPISNQYYEKAYLVFDSVKNVPNAVTVLCNQAINFRSIKDYKSALEAGLRAEAYAKANLNDQAEAYALENVLVTHKALEKNDKALEVAIRLDKIYSVLNDNAKLAPIKDELASLYADLEKNEEAAKAAEEAVKVYQTLSNEKDLANAYWNAGYYLGSSRWQESNAYYENAFNYFKENSTKSATTLLSNIGINFRENNDSAKSYSQHKKAIDFAAERSDTASMIYGHEKFYYTYLHFKNYKGMAEQAIQTALLYHYQGDTVKAFNFYDYASTAIDSLIAYYEKEKKYDVAALAYYTKSQIQQVKGSVTGQAEMLYYAGFDMESHNSKEAWPQALNYFKQSLELYKRVPDRYNAVTYIENHIAKSFYRESNTDSALFYVDRAIILGEEKEYWTNLAKSYQLKAEILSSLKKYDGNDGAIAFYKKAEHAFGKIPEIENQLEASKKLADLLNELKRYEEASKIHLDRLSLIDKSDELKVADIYWNCAYSLSFIPGRLKESNENYLKAAGLFKKNDVMDNYVTVISNIGYNFRDANDSINAYKVMRDLVKATKPKNIKGEGEQLYYLALEKSGHVYKYFGHHEQALASRKQAAEGYERLGDDKKTYELYDDAGKSAEASKQYVLADKLYLKAYNTALKMSDKGKIASALWSVAYNQGTFLQKNKEAIALYEDAYQNYLEAGDTANASIMRSNVAQNYWKLLDFDKAIENHTKAIGIATRGKYFTQVAFSWRKLADLYKETKNPTRQAVAMENAVTVLETLKDTTELLTAYFEIGSSYNESQEINKAENYYSRALKMAQAKKDTLNVAWSYYKYAGLYHGRKPDLAKDYYVKTITLQRKLRDKQNLIYSLASYGSLIMEADRILSEKMLKEALTLSEELKDDYVIAYCHGRLYDLYKSFGKPDVAHRHMGISNSLYKNLKEKNSLANNYVALATEYLYDYGDFTKSRQYMADAKVLLDSINNPLSHANFHAQLCNVFEDQGQFDLALAELDKALEIYRNLKNDWGIAGLYIDYGNIYRTLSEYQVAFKYQSMSDSIYQSLNLQYQRLAPIANIGDIYFDQGDYPKALDYFKRSLKYMEDNKDQNTNICKLYSGVGVTYSYMTNYEEAEKWLMKGLETSRRVNATRTGADILNYLGKLKIETKKYDEAEKFLLEAKAFLLHQNLMVERTSNATHLGHLYLKKGELEKARPELAEAIELAEKFGKEAVLWEAYFRMGDYYRKSGNLAEARNYLMKSVNVIDNLRNNIVGGEEAKKLFSSDKWILEAYEELISVLLELGETEEAMAWLQRINENNVQDKIRSLDVTFEDEEKNKTLAREKELKMKLEAMEKQINAQKQSKSVDTEQIKRLESIKNVAEGDYLKFVNQTVNVQPELSKYFSNTVQPSQLKGKKKQIPNDMALVSYLVGDKQLYIFVATSDTVVARIVSVSKEKIHRDVNAMTNLIKNHLGTFGAIDLKAQEAERKELINQIKQTDPTLKPFEEAYSYLISPIGELLVNKSRLGIIPTGELNYIPFQLLGKTLKSSKFSLLINQFSLFYTNSTDMLLRGVDSEKTLNILAFGNPDKTLPATEKEVNDIKKIFPTAQIYLREEATEDRAKYAPEEYNVMHFATHGNLDYEDFSKSYLTMAGNVAKNEDGMLTLEELWGMDVMSHLNIVVLSACQTAVTKGSDESSPVSPASGFLQNGVKSVVASLWKVDDEATSALMNDFYKNIKTMDAVDAMRAAQINLSNTPKFNHPYYWAAMVLIGDWR